MTNAYFVGVTVLFLVLTGCGGGSTDNGTDIPEMEPVRLISDIGYQTPTAYSGMTLVWADEFESDSLDLTSWSYDVGDGCPSLCGWGNNELEYYTASSNNAYQTEGKLVIEAKPEVIASSHYTSAKLLTRGKQQFKYGRIDIRAKLPEGQGIWPAVWMLPVDNVYGGWPSSGEIDIAELVGHEPAKIHGTIHFGPSLGYSQSRSGSHTLTEGSFADEFHVFSIIWQEDEIQWLVDDIEYHAISRGDVGTNTYPFNQEFYLIMNLAVGGNWPGAPGDETVFPQSMMIDFVRVFQ